MQQVMFYKVKYAYGSYALSNYICDLLCENHPFGTFGISRNTILKH